MNRSLLFWWVFAILGGTLGLVGCGSRTLPLLPSPILSQPVTATPKSPTLPPSPNSEEKQAILQQLSLEWRESGYFFQHSPSDSENLSSCSHVPPSLDEAYSALVPATYVPFLSIANHECDTVLRVFIGCAREKEQRQPNPNQWTEVEGRWFACVSWEVRLILENLEIHGAQILGEIGERHESNSGAIYVPLAFTQDDKHIILNSYMGPPGAGGGLVDYGYDIISSDPSYRTSNNQREHLGPRNSIFYDDYAKVVYTENSGNIPSFSQPGPRSNNGMIVVKDLVTLKPILVLEEPDTTYEILGIDERSRTLSFQAIKHRFSADCERGLDSLRCSEKTVMDRDIPLP